MTSGQENENHTTKDTFSYTDRAVEKLKIFFFLTVDVLLELAL